MILQSDQNYPGIYIKLRIIKIPLEFLFEAPTYQKRQGDKGGGIPGDTLKLIIMWKKVLIMKILRSIKTSIKSH